MRQFVNLPQFPQIRNWWRHTGSCVDFQVSKPNFSDSTFFLRQNRYMPIFLKSILSLSKTISSLRYTIRNAWCSERCPSWRHKSDLLGWSVFLNPQKWPTLKLHNFVKNWYFLMRFFAFESHNWGLWTADNYTNFRLAFSLLEYKIGCVRNQEYKIT